MKYPSYLVPRIGEQRMKEWVAERAIEAGLATKTISKMISRGKLKTQVTRRENTRVVFVRKWPVNNL